MTGGWVLGIDSGGSGLRVGLAHTAHPTEKKPPVGSDDGPEPGLVTAGRLRCAEPVRTGPEGIDAAHLLEQVVPAAMELLRSSGAREVSAACLGAAGMATLGDGLREALPTALSQRLGVRRLALAADAVTAYAGALGERAGAVVAAGTGMIAMGTDLRSWRRADGWGHLLGDCGSGAWIGRAGLEAAMRAHDGREGGSTALLERAEAVFGPVAELPARVYPRADRPALLASFAPEVASCAVDSPRRPADGTASRILRDAAREIARSAAAVCPAPLPGAPAPAVALTGGLFQVGRPLTDPLHAQLDEILPHARTVAPAGDPLDGALRVAARLGDAAVGLPSDPALLSVH